MRNLKVGCALLLLPVLVHAGVGYDVAVRAVDQTNLSLAGQVAAPVVTSYGVDGGKVRVGGASAKTAYLFKDQTMYVIDHASRVIHVLKHATLSQVTAHYVDAVKQLQDAAATAPAEQRAAAEQKAVDMKSASDRLLQPVQRDYRVTVRFESVDGHACRIWEEQESGAKRLELCIAPITGVPGGADILAGMKTLSQFRQGANFALGVDFGLAEWWPDIARLGGVPIFIREYKYDTVVAEVLLTAMRLSAPSGSAFDLPEGYQVQEGPDYAQWYLR